MNSTRRRIALMLISSSLALISAGGCQRPLWRKLDIHGAGYEKSEDDADLKEMRPAANEKRFTGVDGRARDIERNLGVR